MSGASSPPTPPTPPTPARIVQAATQALRAGRLQDAERFLQAIVPQLESVPDPVRADAHGLLTVITGQRGDLPQALRHAREAARLMPLNPVFATNAGMALAASGEADAAITALTRAIELGAADLPPRLTLAQLLYLRGRISEAIEATEAALKTFGMHPDLVCVHALALQSAGRAAEGVRVLEAWLARPAVPGDDAPRARAMSALASMLNYAGAPAARVFAAHARWGELVDARAVTARRALARIPAPRGARARRVAFLSPDLRAHSVAFFVELLLEHLDRARVEVHCYSLGMPDEVTARLRAHVERGSAGAWLDARPLGDDDLAARIRADDIDILIDLAGHTRDHVVSRAGR